MEVNILYWLLGVLQNYFDESQCKLKIEEKINEIFLGRNSLQPLF